MSDAKRLRALKTELGKLGREHCEHRSHSTYDSHCVGDNLVIAACIIEDALEMLEKEEVE